MKFIACISYLPRIHALLESVLFWLVMETNHGK